MPHLFDQAQLADVLATHGYWAIFLVVALESAGVPLPGETMLVAAAIYARLTGALVIEYVVPTAAAGAIIGDNIGYWIGRTFGVRLMRKYGRHVGLTEDKLHLGQYLFHRWGGAIVFFGRFVALLRILAAMLAGANHLPAPRFLFYNAAGGIVWACVFGFGAYFLTAAFQKLERPIAILAIGAALAGGVAMWRYYKLNEDRLMEEAKAHAKESALPP